MKDTEILVCVLCRAPGDSRDMPRAGRYLLEAIENEALSTDLSPTIRAVECMSGCKRACAVALQSEGKFSYMFGDLVADAESAKQVLSCAVDYHLSADGVLLRAARPLRLQEGILAKLPPGIRHAQQILAVSGNGG